MKTLLNYIRGHPLDPNGKGWNYAGLTKNPHLTWKLIQENLDLPWDLTGAINENPNITEEILRQHPEIPWNYSILSKNPKISSQFIADHREYSWQHSSIFIHGQMIFDEDFFISILEQSEVFQQVIVGCISQNPNLQLAHVLAYPMLPWSKSELVFNVNLTIEFVLNCPSFVRGTWDWGYLSMNPNFTFATILKYPELPWSREKVSQNPNITEMDLVKNPRYPWRFNWLSANPNLSFRFIVANAQVGWSSPGLNRNPNFRLEEILAHPDFASWNFEILLEHIRGTSYEAQLQVLHQQQNNRLSYWSLLPKDMLRHYLGLYFD